MLIGALYFLGQWAVNAQPAGDDPAPPAGDDRSGGSNPMPEQPAPPAGEASGPHTQAGPGGGAPSEPSAAEPGAATPDAGAEAGAGTGDAAPAASDPGGAAELAAARARIDRSGGQAETRTVTVYFIDLAREMTMQPVQVRLPLSQTPLKDIVNTWLAPPEELRLTTGVPAGTALKGGLKRDGNAVLVDVSRDLYARGRGGTQWANSLVYTLVYSLTEFDGIDRVQLTVNGFPAELEGWVWSHPIGRDELPGGAAFRVEPLIKYQP